MAAKAVAEFAVAHLLASLLHLICVGGRAPLVTVGANNYTLQPSLAAQMSQRTRSLEDPFLFSGGGGRGAIVEYRADVSLRTTTVTISPNFELLATCQPLKAFIADNVVANQLARSSAEDCPSP